MSAATQVAELQRLAEQDTLGAELLRHVAAVERTMQKIHGGTWHIGINHHTCFVLVARDIR